MKDIINGLIERFRRQHVQARRYVAMMLVLALLTTLFVNWQLHGVGISMTADYHCGYEEHQHTAACYEKVLTCGYEEGEPETPVTSSDSSADLVSAYSAEEPEELEEPVQTEPETIWVPHEHTDACYEEHRVLTCYQEEHEHTDDCFDEYGALICGEFEHIHDDSCYTTEYELVCGLDEGELVEEPNPAYQEMPASRPVVDLPPEPAETTPAEPVLHHHTDACYTEELVCTIPEHHHTVECLADTQADVETAEEWQAAANVALNGNWAEDLLTVAKSQLDYQQSDKNFKLDVEDQQVLRGYSRYGAWYGNPYGAWDVMFLSYCLHFAGVPQTVVPQRAGVMALHSDLRGSQWLTDADGSTARPGDIVIYNTLTTEQVAVDESSYGIALLDLDEDPDTAAQLTASEPQVDTRTVTTETVGVVSAVDPDAGTLTVISGNVDGKVAEVPAAMSDVTSVISVTGAYAAETTAVENFTAYVDAICIRCIIKGTSICMCLIGKHGRCSRKNIFCDQILADNGDYHTCRSDVLLNAAIDNTIFAYINRLGKETGGYICHKCFALCIWKLFELGSINGVVLTDINIVCIRADRQIAAIRNVRESLILGRSNLVCFSVLLCFLVCFLCPLTGYNVVSHLIFHKVHWDHGKLLGSAALKEKYLIVIRNIHQLTKILLSCVNDFLECSTSVAHFHNGHAGTIVIHHFICDFFQHLFRKDRRSCGKIVHSAHFLIPFLSLLLRQFPTLPPPCPL